MSSLNQTSTDQLENKVVVRRGGIIPSSLLLFMQQALGNIFKDDVNGFSSTSDICFMVTARYFCPNGRM
jgi:hypothetical protein